MGKNCHDSALQMCRISGREVSCGSSTGELFAGGGSTEGPTTCCTTEGPQVGGRCTSPCITLKSVWVPRKHFLAREQLKTASGLKPPALINHSGAFGLMSFPEIHLFFSHEWL